MLEDRFTLLLNEISEQIGVELKPDSNNSCLINIKGQLEIQLEINRDDESQLLVASLLGALQPGKFREEMLQLALRANAKPYPRFGNFAYTTKLNSLVLFENLNIDQLKIGDIMSLLIPFIHKASTWKEAVEKSDFSPHILDVDYITLKNDNLFR